MGRESPSPGTSAIATARWGEAITAVAAVLELTASEQPELLGFQTHVLRNSTMSFASKNLATTFDVPHDQVGQTVSQACKHLDRLEKHRGTPDPLKALDSPNLPALLYVCQARLDRVTKLVRQQRLERIKRKVQRAYDLALTRARIEAFLGLKLPDKPRETQRANR